jgi:hypothetical protein
MTEENQLKELAREGQSHNLLLGLCPTLELHLEEQILKCHLPNALQIEAYTA